MSNPEDCRKIAPLLPALPDEDLPPPAVARIQAHLAICPACREEARALLGLGELLRQVPVPEANLPTGAQAVAWIERAVEGRAESEIRSARFPGPKGTGLSQDKDRERPWGHGSPTGFPAGFSRLPKRQTGPFRAGEAGHLEFRGHSFHAIDLGHRAPARLALVALGVAACLLAWRAVRPPDAAWEVVRLAGAPRVGAARIGATGRLEVGEWLVTDGSSQARIELANVGQVQIGPNTRLRLVEARPHEHRLALARGTLRALVSAPPRLFFVDTPSAEAVDLGCAYDLAVDAAGCGLLRVTWGRVAFVKNGRETVVPAGARCETRPGIGPGTPYFDDAPAALRRALAQLDFENGGDRALGDVLAAARRRDSLSLWHLLLKLPSAEQGHVYDRLAELVPPPAGVTREGVLLHDARMLGAWQAEMEMAGWE